MKNQRLFKDTFLTLITLVIFGSTNFLFNVIVGRIFGSAYLGMVSTALSTALFMSYVVSASLPSAVAKYTSEYLGKKKEEYANYVLRMGIKYGLIIGLSLSVFSFIFSSYFCKLFNIPERLFYLAIPLIFLYGLYMILKMAYYGFRKVGNYFRSEIFADFMFLFVLAIIALFKWNSYIYLPYFLLYLFFIMRAFYFFHSRLSVKLDNVYEVNRKFFRFAVVSFIGTFSSMSMVSLSIMISSMYVSASDVGYLSAAFAISSIFFLLPNAVTRVLMPEFSFNFGKGDTKTTMIILNKSTEYLTVFVTIFNSLGILLAPYIVKFFYGSEYFYTIVLLQLTLLRVWLPITARPLIALLSGTKYVHIPNTVSVFGLFLALGLWVLFIPQYGVLATAIVYLIEAWCIISILIYFGYKYFQFRPINIFKHVPFILIVFLINIFFQRSFYVVLGITVLVLGSYILLNRKMFKQIKNIIIQIIIY